jgi:hypothetical protein
MEGILGIMLSALLFLIIGGVIVFALLTKHKERTTMLDKGFRPEEIRELYRRGAVGSPNALSSLKWGLVFAAIGIAVILGIILESAFQLQEGIYFGLIALFGGAGLMLFYAIAGKKAPQP